MHANTTKKTNKNFKRQGFCDWLESMPSIASSVDCVILPCWVDCGAGYHPDNTTPQKRTLEKYGIQTALWYSATGNAAIQHARKTYKKRNHVPVVSVAPCLENNHLQDFVALKRYGVRAVWIDEKQLTTPDRLLHALRIAKSQAIVAIATPNLSVFAPQAQAHASSEAIRLGIAGHPPIAERSAVHLLVELAIESGAHIHINGISCGACVPIIQTAKKNKAPISADVGIDNLLYTCQQVRAFATEYKVWPPLRDNEDKQQLQQGVIDGIIDAITTRHISVNYTHKNRPFFEATFGRATYPHLGSMLMNLHEHGMSWKTIAYAIHANPAHILGIAHQKQTGTFMVIDTTTNTIIAPT